MSLRKKRLPTVDALPRAAAAGTATCNLNLGKGYHKIVLEISDDGTSSAGNAGDIDATLDALVGDIRVKLNGKVQRVHTGSQLNAINGVNGAAFRARDSGTAGTSGYKIYLPIFFAEPWRKNNFEARSAAWNAVGIDSFQVEVDFLSGTTTPNVTGYYEWDLPSDNKIGLIVKQIRQSLGAVGSTQDFTNLDRSGILQALHLFPVTNAIYVNKVKLTANSVEIHDLLDTLENQGALLDRELNPDVSAVPRYDLVLDYDDPVLSGLQLAGLSELTLHVEYSAAANGTLTTIPIKVGPPE